MYAWGLATGRLSLKHDRALDQIASNGTWYGLVAEIRGHYLYEPSRALLVPSISPLFLCSGFRDSTYFHPISITLTYLSTGLWNEMLSVWLPLSVAVLEDKYAGPINYLNSLIYKMAIVMVRNSEIRI